MNGSACFCLNLSCEATGSRDTPMTTAPVLPKSGSESRKPQASAVQPEVSSFG